MRLVNIVLFLNFVKGPQSAEILFITSIASVYITGISAHKRPSYLKVTSHRFINLLNTLLSIYNPGSAIN
jgi:hypothetical protein